MTRDPPDGTEPGPHLRAPAPVRVRPAHVAVAAVLAGALWFAVGPVNDLDSYWHVEVGREILARHTVVGLGQAWIGTPQQPWRTSQWLAEVGMYAAVERFGWIALPVLRLLAASALFAVLTITLVRRRQPIAALVVLLPTVAGVEELLQDRPATLSLVLVALLGAACERLWSLGIRPRPWLVAVLSLLWAQLHGTWVIAPGAFLLVAAGALTDRRNAVPGQARKALTCAAASAAGIVNPWGPASFLLPTRFRSVGQSFISEWAPTEFNTLLTSAWGVLLLLLVMAWVRSPTRVPGTEVVWTFTWTVFGVLALRNVGPVILLMAPVVLRAIERSASTRLARFTAQPSARAGRLLTGLLAAVAVAAAAAVTAALARVDPLQRTPALGIARRLATAPGPVRVFDDYNVSGALVAFARARDGHVRLVVDGRSDLWGPDYIDRYVRTLHLGDGWYGDFVTYRADAAVLTTDAPLTAYLTSLPLDQRWQVVMRDDRYVLLAPPGSKL